MKSSVKQHIKDLFDSSIKYLRNSKKTILLIIVVATITIVLNTLILTWLSRTGNYTLPTLGGLHTTGVKAYGGDIIDENGEQQIDWGTVYPGTLTTRSFYLQSESSVKKVLTFRTTDRAFLDSEGNDVAGSLSSKDLEDALIVTWNYDGTPVSREDSEIYVTFTLNVSSNIDFINYLIDERVETFSFDIHIYTE